MNKSPINSLSLDQVNRLVEKTYETKKTSLPTIVLLITRLKRWQNSIRNNNFSNTTNRLNFWRLLVKDIIKINRNQFWESMKNIKVLKTDTTSSSLIMIANIKPVLKNDETENFIIKYFLEHGKTVFIKLTFKNRLDIIRNSEAKIYKYFINKLVHKRNTPNLMLFLQDFKVLDIPKLVKESNNKELNEALVILNKKERLEKEGSLMFLECGNGILLDEFLTKDTSLVDLYPIIFQIFYTIKCLNISRLKHNDLHTRNIFLQKLVKTDKKTFVYFIDNDTYFVVKNNSYFPLLFDWDLSFSPLVTTKKQAEALDHGYSKFGMCAEENDKFDLHGIISSILAYSKFLPKELTDYLKKGFGNVSNPNINQNLLARINPICKIPECYFNKMCKIKVVNINNRPRYICDGCLKVDNSVLQPTSWFIYNFPKTENSVELKFLPEFDPDFLPNNFNFNDCVFALPNVDRQKLKLDLVNMNIQKIKF